MEESNGLGPELESFRQQWLSEVRTKRGEQSTQPQPRNSVPSASTAPPPPRKSMARRPSPAKSRKAPPAAEEEDEYLHGRSFDDSPEPSGNTIDGSVRMPPQRELVSALDHYEEAMEKEALGNMGDSLKLYRKAYRVSPRKRKSLRITVHGSDEYRWTTACIAAIARSTSHSINNLKAHPQRHQRKSHQQTPRPQEATHPSYSPSKTSSPALPASKSKQRPPKQTAHPPRRAPSPASPASSSSTSCRTWRPST